MSYLLKLAIAFDQFINTLFNGAVDETLSARIYRNRNVNNYWRFYFHFVNTLFFWQENHCYQAYLSETQRKHLPESYKNDLS